MDETKRAGWLAIREVVNRDHKEYCGGCDDCEGSIDAETDELWEAARKD